MSLVIFSKLFGRKVFCFVRKFYLIFNNMGYSIHLYAGLCNLKRLSIHAIKICGSETKKKQTDFIL